MLIISVSELCALVNSEKIRDRGLCNKPVTGVVRNIAAGFTRMLLQNTARFYGARLNTNFFKLTSNVRPSLHQLVQDTKIINKIPWKISRTLSKPEDKCAKYRHKLTLKTHNHTVISIRQLLFMKIGQEMWKMRVKLNISPCVNCDLNYTDFHKNHNTQQYCVQIYTEFQPNLRYMESTDKHSFTPLTNAWLTGPI